MSKTSAKTSAKTAAPRKASARKASTPKLSASGACVTVLRSAKNKPLPTKTIAERAIKLWTGGKKGPNGGSTPSATISALLAVSHVRGGKFERTAPGFYRLRVEAPAGKKKATAKK